MSTPPAPGARPTAWLAWLAHAASAAALLLLAVLPAHKYAWMDGIDPGVDPAALEDASGNRQLVMALCVLLALGLQALALWRGWRHGGGRGQRVAALVLVLALLAAWAFKAR